MHSETGNTRRGAVLGGGGWIRVGRVAFAVSVEVSRKELALWGLDLKGQVWAGDLACSWQLKP